MQVLTNGTYQSVEHRVIVNAAVDRLSIAYFHNPQDDLLITPANEFMTRSGHAKYRPMKFKDYKMQIRTQGPVGKSHVDLLRTT